LETGFNQKTCYFSGLADALFESLGAEEEDEDEAEASEEAFELGEPDELEELDSSEDLDSEDLDSCWDSC